MRKLLFIINLLGLVGTGSFFAAIYRTSRVAFNHTDDVVRQEIANSTTVADLKAASYSLIGAFEFRQEAYRSLFQRMARLTFLLVCIYGVNVFLIIRLPSAEDVGAQDK